MGDRELQVVMNAIGKSMELAEINENIAIYASERDANDPMAKNELNMEEFIRFITNEMQQDQVQEELKEAYRKFSGSDDTEMGFSRQQLQETMNNYGERRLSDDEFGQLFNEMDAD